MYTASNSPNLTFTLAFETKAKQAHHHFVKLANTG